MTQPLAPAIIKALHAAVDEMGAAETFHGYAPDLGYEFLRSAIAKMIMNPADVTSVQMRFLYLTEQNVILPIFRSYSPQIVRLQSATRFIRFM